MSAVDKCPPNQPKEAAAKLLEAFTDMAIQTGATPEGDPCILIPADRVREAAERAKALGFDFVLSLSALDLINEGKMLLLYTYMSYKPELRGILLHIRSEVPRDNPRVQTIIDIFPNADYEEREAHEMFGIWFEGNPNMGRRFLLDPDCCRAPDGSPLYPLRKDFRIPDWQTIA